MNLPGVIATLGPLGHDAAEVRARAEALLSRPPFVENAPGPIRRLIRSVGDRVAAFLGEVFGEAFGSGLLPWIMVGLGTTLLGWLVWRITRDLTVDRSLVEVPAATVTRSPADWHGDADAATARGEFREALRYRYAALAATLIGAGILEDVPGRTVRELELAVAGTVPGIADAVAGAGRRFEAAVYGRREVTADDLDVVAAAARAARRSIEGPSARETVSGDVPGRRR